MDARLLNSLLAAFVNKPNGLQVKLEGGQLQLQQDGNGLALDPIQLNQVLRLTLKPQNVAPIAVQVTQLHLGAQGLTVSLSLEP